jgi:hypothetical protein
LSTARSKQMLKHVRWNWISISSARLERMIRTVREQAKQWYFDRVREGDIDWWWNLPSALFPRKITTQSPKWGASRLQR